MVRNFDKRVKIEFAQIKTRRGRESSQEGRKIEKIARRKIIENLGKVEGEGRKEEENGGKKEAIERVEEAQRDLKDKERSLIKRSLLNQIRSSNFSI